MSHGLPLETALAACADNAPAMEEEEVAVEASAGRILARDVASRVELPPFTASAMDGIAVRSADCPGILRVVGESRAGAPFAGDVGSGETCRVSTGAEVPQGADAVVRREEVRELGAGRVQVAAPVPVGRDVRGRGEVIRAGGLVMRRGAIVHPHQVGPIAAAGQATVGCRRRPRVALLTTGDELVDAGVDAGPGQLVDSNAPGLAAQVRAAGAVLGAVERVRDDAAAIGAALERLLAPDGAPPPDLLLTSGGVSVGDHDHVRPALAALGVEEIFWGVAMRPGHPTWLGRRGHQVVLGLPGNPVSAAVCMHVFGRPLLGHAPPFPHRMPLAAPHVKDHGRAELVRGTLTPDGVLPGPAQQSHAVTSMAAATLLAWIPADARSLAAGADVRVELLTP